MMKHIVNNHPNEALAVTGERMKRAEQRQERKREAEATGTGASSNKRSKSSSAGKGKNGHIRIKMNRATLLKATTTLCSVNGRPTKIVEDSGLRMLLDPILDGLRQAGEEDVPEINRQNVRMDICKEAEELREKIRNEVKGKLVCLKLDTATRMNRKILCINIQYTHNGSTQLRMIGLIETFESHTSSYLKDRIMDTLWNFRINPRNVYTGTTDNAANIKKAVCLLPSLSLEDTLIDYGCHHSILPDNGGEAGAGSDEEGCNSTDEDDPDTVHHRSASALSESSIRSDFVEGDSSDEQNGASSDEDDDGKESDGDVENASVEVESTAPPLGSGSGDAPAPDCEECRMLKAALRDVGAIHVSCAAHTLQLGVRDAVKQTRGVSGLFVKARKLAKKLRTSTYAARLESMKLPKAILDVETRWGSSHDMLAVLLLVKDACITIGQEEEAARQERADRRARTRGGRAKKKKKKEGLPNLKPAEWRLLEEVCDALEPAKIATVKLQKETLTAGDFYDAWLTCKETTRRKASPLARNLVACMEAREKSLLATEAFAPALFMDPRYRCLLDRDPALVKQAMVHLQGLWLRLTRANESETERPLVTTPPPSHQADEDEEDIDPVEKMLRESERLAASSTPSTPTKDVGLLLSSYRTWARLEKSANVLEFWETKKVSDPELYLLATTVLAVPMTQVSVERVFSHLRQILSILRYNLSSSAIADILLLKVNAIFMSRKKKKS